MQAYVLGWLDLIVRWFHVAAGISWIGASFYFVWLDDSLDRGNAEAARRSGLEGDLWSVHGGGFYHNEKYPTGPAGRPPPDRLHWFYWEAYSTWLSGIAMLAIVYWTGASAFLVDKRIANLAPSEAIAISIGSLVVGWLIYDALCRLLEKHTVALWTAIALLLLAFDWGYFHVFGPRGAFIHIGALIGTLMVWNVFFVIIPGQRKVVAQLRAGAMPDPRPGARGKQRSVQNTYFTLPVLFVMIGVHAPMTYDGPYGWLVVAGLATAGVLVRRFYVLTHGARRAVALPVAALALVAVIAYLLAPRSRTVARFADVAPIVAQRCAPCHAAHPTADGFAAAPAGLLLDTPERIVAAAARIRAQAVASHAMPPGNPTHMTEAERATLGAWIDAGAKGP